MKNFFDSETPLMRFLSTLGDLIVINFLFLICSIPVITIGPALSAANKTMFRLREHTCDNVPKTFFLSFRENFKSAVLVWCSALPCFLLLLLHFFLLFSSEAGNSKLFLLAVWLLISLGIVGLLSYLFPLIARYQNSLAQHLKNAAILIVSQFPHTLCLVMLNISPILIFLFVPALFFYLMPFWLLVGASGLIWLNTLLLKPVFAQLDQLSAHTFT